TLQRSWLACPRLTLVPIFTVEGCSVLQGAVEESVAWRGARGGRLAGGEGGGGGGGGVEYEGISLSQTSESHFRWSEHQREILHPSQHFTSQRYTSQHFTSQHFTSQHFTSQHFTSQPFTSQCFTSQPFTSQPFTSQPFTSQPFTSQHFTSSSILEHH
ncbi:hypothetical protein Pcinc_029985, partial [Petrolisthes cinctipes]